MSDGQVHSTGRGGTGNIGKDDTPYVDASIHREGAIGKSADGEYSTGRGGAGNVDTTTKHTGHRTDEEYVPEQNLREPYAEYHTGRGGSGNVHKDKYGGHSSAAEQKAAEGHKESLLDKAKNMIGKK